MGNSKDAEIKSYYDAISDLETQRSSYREDYAILVDEENEIVKIISICDKIELSSNGFSLHLDKIENISQNGNATIPGMDDIINFEIINEDVQRVLKANNDYIENLKKICSKIDILKTEIANKINSIDSQIIQYQAKIYNAQNAYVTYY